MSKVTRQALGAKPKGAVSCEGMRDPTPQAFGLLIAFVAPGVVVLWGACFLAPSLRTLLLMPADAGATIAGMLFASIGAVSCGVTVSAVRWAVIDRLHAWSGLPPPAWNFARLASHARAYELLTEIHYRYYQFYANMLVAIAFAVGSVALSNARPDFDAWTGAGFAAIAVILFFGSRDSLKKYYTRVSAVLGDVSSENGQETPRILECQ